MDIGSRQCSGDLKTVIERNYIIISYVDTWPAAVAWKHVLTVLRVILSTPFRAVVYNNESTSTPLQYNIADDNDDNHITIVLCAANMATSMTTLSADDYASENEIISHYTRTIYYGYYGDDELTSNSCRSQSVPRTWCIDDTDNVAVSTSDGSYYSQRRRVIWH